jgi:hypothetical protein
MNGERTEEGGWEGDTLAQPPPSNKNNTSLDIWVWRFTTQRVELWSKSLCRQCCIKLKFPEVQVGSKTRSPEEVAKTDSATMPHIPA